MVVYETIIIMGSEVRARITDNERDAVEYAQHVARWYLGLEVSNTRDADTLQERIIDDERVAYADVAVERRLY